MCVCVLSSLPWKARSVFSYVSHLTSYSLFFFFFFFLIKNFSPFRARFRYNAAIVGVGLLARGLWLVAHAHRAFDCIMAAEVDVMELYQEAEQLVAEKNISEAIPVLVNVGEFYLLVNVLTLLL